ncbi:hypothetical protein [Acholeplasma hippikon]|uniref:Uncharacterized protein n=1 Tax=Acholeplasma hippikon TaxID=264636 RepID=A0A449BK28_9MOLU|nr:hypothetical protein [Acholeplasma hippikon]VEU82743.1 Uncharacterised protein [Acholeplasma hippikon]
MIIDNKIKKSVARLYQVGMIFSLLYSATLMYLLYIQDTNLNILFKHPNIAYLIISIVSSLVLLFTLIPSLNDGITTYKTILLGIATITNFIIVFAFANYSTSFDTEFTLINYVFIYFGILALLFYFKGYPLNANYFKSDTYTLDNPMIPMKLIGILSIVGYLVIFAIGNTLNDKTVFTYGYPFLITFFITLTLRGEISYFRGYQGIIHSGILISAFIILLKYLNVIFDIRTINFDPNVTSIDNFIRIFYSHFIYIFSYLLDIILIVIVSQAFRIKKASLFISLFLFIMISSITYISYPILITKDFANYNSNLSFFITIMPVYKYFALIFIYMSKKRHIFGGRKGLISFVYPAAIIAIYLIYSFYPEVGKYLEYDTAVIILDIIYILQLIYFYYRGRYLTKFNDGYAY